jgi:hypothetical protein
MSPDVFVIVGLVKIRHGFSGRVGQEFLHQLVSDLVVRRRTLRFDFATHLDSIGNTSTVSKSELSEKHQYSKCEFSKKHQYNKSVE